MARLLIVAGALQGQRFEMIDECLTIGRSPDNLARLDDTSVSKHHAMITLEGDDYKLWDLHSTNGTHVNDKRIVVAHLKNNDQVRFGDVILHFERAEKKRTQPLDAGAAPPPAAPVTSPEVLPDPVPEILKPHPVVPPVSAPVAPEAKPPEPQIPIAAPKPETPVPVAPTPIAAPASKDEPTRLPTPAPKLADKTSPARPEPMSPPVPKAGLLSRPTSGWHHKNSDVPPEGLVPVARPIAPSPAVLLGAPTPPAPAKPSVPALAGRPKPPAEVLQPRPSPPAPTKPVELTPKKAVQTPQTEWMTVVPPIMPPKPASEPTPAVAATPQPRKMPYLVIFAIGGIIFMVGYALESHPLNFVGLLLGAFGLVALFVAPQPLPKRR